jgi:hypothetical protein
VRNQDVFTTTERGVTTVTDDGTFSGDSTHLINRSNVKNIRTLEVDSTDLTYGEDYTIDLNYDDSGTTKCKITFTSSQTGDYSISYDYGTDKIWGDFPRDDLTINSYPRIAVDFISKTEDAFGIGGTQFISNTSLTCVMYGEDQDEIDETLQDIISAVRTNAKNFYYAPFIKPIGQGPLIKSENRSQTILHRNADFLGMFEVN